MQASSLHYRACLIALPAFGLLERRRCLSADSFALPHSLVECWFFRATASLLERWFFRATASLLERWFFRATASMLERWFFRATASLL